MFQAVVDAQRAVPPGLVRVVMAGGALPATKTKGGKMGEHRLPRKNEHLMKAGRMMIRTPLTKAFVACLMTALYGVDVRDQKWADIERLSEALRERPTLTCPVGVFVAHTSHKVDGETGLGLNDLDGPIPVLLDALKLCGVIADDVLNVRMFVDKLPATKKAPGLGFIVGPRHGGLFDDLRELGELGVRTLLAAQQYAEKIAKPRAPARGRSRRATR